MASDWITTEEAAEITGYHPEYLRKLIRNTKIYAEKKGNTWWVDRKAVLTYLAEAERSEDKRWGAKSKA